MPNPNPAQPIPPGGAGGDPGKFPQYGLNPNNGEIKVANDGQEKVKLIDQGYVDWFTSRKAAEDAAKGMKGTFGTGNVPNPLHGLDSIGATLQAFYADLTDWKLWRSLGWIVLGVALVIAGLYLWFRTSGMYSRLEGEFTSAVGKVA